MKKGQAERMHITARICFTQAFDGTMEWAMVSPCNSILVQCSKVVLVMVHNMDGLDVVWWWWLWDKKISPKCTNHALLSQTFSLWWWLEHYASRACLHYYGQNHQLKLPFQRNCRTRAAVIFSGEDRKINLIWSTSKSKQLYSTFLHGVILLSRGYVRT